MARKPKVQARVSHDLKAAVEDYTDEREDISDAEAVREVLRAGLAEKGHPVAVIDGGDNSGGVRYLSDSLLKRLAAPRVIGVSLLLIIVSAALMAAAGVFAQNGALAATVVTAGAATAVLVVAAGIVWTAALARIALARPLRGIVGLGSAADE